MGITVVFAAIINSNQQVGSDLAVVQMATEGDITDQLWTVHQVSEKSVKHTIIESDL